MKLWIGSIKDCTREDLEKYFSDFGVITELTLKRNYGFLQYQSVDSARTVLYRQIHHVNGNQITVLESVNRQGQIQRQPPYHGHMNNWQPMNHYQSYGSGMPCCGDRTGRRNRARAGSPMQQCMPQCQHMCDHGMQKRPKKKQPRKPNVPRYTLWIEMAGNVKLCEIGLVLENEDFKINKIERKEGGAIMQFETEEELKKAEEKLNSLEYYQDMIKASIYMGKKKPQEDEKPQKEEQQTAEEKYSNYNIDNIYAGLESDGFKGEYGQQPKEEYALLKDEEYGKQAEMAISQSAETLTEKGYQGMQN